MLTLVLGGAASGKSEYAESLVLRTTGPRWYLATMQIWDAECAARVEKHRKMRAAKQFETVECPLHLEKLRLPPLPDAAFCSRRAKALALPLPPLAVCRIIG